MNTEHLKGVLIAAGSTLCGFFVVRKTTGMRLTACILRRAKYPGRGNVMIRINWGAQRIEVPTDHSIDVKHWDAKTKQRALLAFV